jgi:two-component system alkaline phosphatase synthesis response regulator PhoP
MSDKAQPAQAESSKILVVDDDPQIVRLIRSYLEQAGYIVESASDGETALHAMRTLRPDLVVLDLGLPGRDGLEVTRMIRSDAHLSHTPIMMLTARIDDVDRILGLEMGADDYVIKPFNPREVLARVKAIMRRTRPPVEQQANDLLSVDDLVLDRSAHVVMRQGQSIDLTPSEFDILHLLMRHPGRAFTRTEIIEIGLGYEYAGLERTVDSHIKNLRRKLEDDPRQPAYIETVFGIGYRLNPRGGA